MLPERLDDVPTPEEVEEARTMLACPYYADGNGTCVTGCMTEPACWTCAPNGGWEGVLERAGITP